MRCLIALRRWVLRWLVLGQDLHCAVLVAAREFDMPRQIALEDARVGMVKTVAIAYPTTAQRIICKYLIFNK